MESCQLSNGLGICYYPIDHAYSVAIGLYVNAGSIFETQKNNGITHMLEHMHFRRLGPLNQQKIYEKMDCIGGNLRAATYKNLLRFSMKIRPKYFMEALTFFKYILTTYDWNSEEFKLEQRVVLSELYEKQDYTSIGPIMDQLLWKENPLALQVIGTEDAVSRLTVEQLIEYKKQVFTKGNVALVVTGAITRENMDAINRMFATVPLHEAKSCMHSWLPQGTKETIGTAMSEWIETNGDYAQACIGFAVDCEKVTQEQLIVLSSIVGGGTGALLQRALREKRGLVYDVQSYATWYHNQAAFCVEFSAYNAHMYSCVKCALEQLHALKTNINQRDMDSNMPYYTDNLWYWMEDPERLNQELGFDIFYQFPLWSIQQKIERFRQVEREQLLSVAKEIVQPINTNLVVIGDIKKTEKEKTISLLTNYI